MTSTNDQFTELQRKNMEAAMRLAQVSLDQSQRIMALQAELAKRLFDDGLANAKALAAAKSPQDLVGLRSGFAQETAGRMVEAAQKIAEISNEARDQISQMVTDQLTSSRNEMAGAFKSFFKALPGGNHQLGDVMEQEMNNANEYNWTVMLSRNDLFTSCGQKGIFRKLGNMALQAFFSAV